MSVAELNLIFVDVEAVGLTPINGTMTEFGAVHYHSRTSFHGVLHDSEPDPANPAKSIITGPGMYDCREVMRDFNAWLNQFPGRPIFVSDNNGYDFMWIACEFDRWDLLNPFGHSSRRISDFYAGLRFDVTKTQQWKKWRVTPHDHNPVHDAMGNVEAFAHMMGLVEEKRARLESAGTAAKDWT